MNGLFQEPYTFSNAESWWGPVGPSQGQRPIWINTVCSTKVPILSHIRDTLLPFLSCIYWKGTVKNYLAWDNMISLKCFYNNIFAHVKLLTNLRPKQDGTQISIPYYCRIGLNWLLKDLPHPWFALWWISRSLLTSIFCWKFEIT